MASSTTVSDVFPLGSRVNERGRLEVGGCDLIELAASSARPPTWSPRRTCARGREPSCRPPRDAGNDELEVVFASKAFPCSAVLELFADEGLWCDVASGGELHLALSAGFPPERLVLHGNAKSHAELRTALRHRLGAIVIDNFDELERLRELIAAGALEDPAREDAPAQQPVLVRVTPDVAGDTHEKISTGQANSKFGFSMDQAASALEQAGAVDGLRLLGVHAHIGSQLLRADAVRPRRGRPGEPRRAARLGPGRRPRRPLHRAISSPRPRSRSTSRRSSRRPAPSAAATRPC